MAFYGQCQEDAYISQFFPQSYTGTCVEVGAADGITHSNTYHFERKGWKTLCFEPSPNAFKQCQINRKQCINCCISDADKGLQDFTVYQLNDDTTSAISSLVPDDRLVNKLSSLVKGVVKVKMSVRSLTSVLDELKFPRHLDFVSIDTENTELDVLKGIDFDKYHIKMLVIENNYDEPFCQNYLKQFGYVKVNRISVNDFFVRLI